MRAFRTSIILSVLIGLIIPAFILHEYSSIKTAEAVGSEKYLPASTCRNCHNSIFDQHSQSMHGKSFDNPVFQAQYFEELLPNVKTDASLSGEAKGCIVCHAPISYITSGHIVKKDQVDPEMSGITCDFCHTIRGYKDKSPGNGNYISSPSEQKLGTLMNKSTWHHTYSELHTKSEFCAICHNAVNHHGLEIKSTYTEWKNSQFAKDGIQCQDCHMNAMGFLVGGRPVYESGMAARMTLGRTPYRPKLYTHNFPGAHSRIQVVGAVTLDMEVDEIALSAGNELAISVFVNNARTGHKMPSGSADLRLLFLELKAFIKDRAIDIPARSNIGTDGYDVTGKGAFDSEILADDIPKGRRIYRTIFVDNAGKQTLSSYNAEKIVFDNRLNASEIRKENYQFRIPEKIKGELPIVAKLYYLPYPAFCGHAVLAYDCLEHCPGRHFPRQSHKGHREHLSYH